MTDEAPARIVPCPQCRKPVQWHPDNAWRPFCSERCKMLDLGDWANERHSIPDDPASEGPDFPDPEE